MCSYDLLISLVLAWVPSTFGAKCHGVPTAAVRIIIINNAYVDMYKCTSACT